MSAAICARCRAPTPRACRAPTPCMPGCWSGADRRPAGSGLIRPTPCSHPTSISCSRSAAIIPTLRRWTVSSSARAGSISRSASASRLRQARIPMAVSSTFKAGSGAGYDQIMGRWSARLAEVFLDFCGCSDGEDILDAGCGTGSITSALARRITPRSITGVDFSPIYVDDASGAIRDPRITFEVGDICALPFADRSFDRVLSLLVLLFVPQTARPVAELRRVARPGATVAAAVWDVGGGYVANRMFYDTAATFDDEGRKRRAHNYTRPMTRPGELAAAWRAAGF